jgi:hypothetical protein
VLTLTISLLTALYLLGPDFVSRYILTFAVPRRIIQQTRTEEFARAISTAIFPLLLALAWIYLRHVVSWAAIKGDIQTVFSGLQSEKIFEHDPAHFYAAAKAAFRANWSLTWRLYILLIAYSVAVNVVILNYGAIRNLKFFRENRSARKALATFILPRVSEWHVLLTRFSHSKTTRITADLLTKADVLYRGIIEEPLLLAPDGSLSGILLSGPPFRFDRQGYLAAKNANPATAHNKDLYWKEIPSHTFFIAASEIVTINLRKYEDAPDELEKLLGEILNKRVVAKWARQIGEGPVRPPPK